tara:strand:+ start:213 stop:647 length:435 start_codon:yes stop_codon:yes gene_type:complete
MITQILINKKFSKNQTNQLEKLGFDIRQYDDSPHEEDYFVDLLQSVPYALDKDGGTVAEFVFCFNIRFGENHCRIGLFTETKDEGMRHHHEIKISEFNQDTVPNILAGLKENDRYLMLSKEFEKEHSVVLDGAKELSELLETYK